MLKLDNIGLVSITNKLNYLILSDNLLDKNELRLYKKSIRGLKLKNYL